MNGGKHPGNKLAIRLRMHAKIALMVSHNQICFINRWMLIFNNVISILKNLKGNVVVVIKGCGELVFGVVYYIWKAMNERSFVNKQVDAVQLFHEIKACSYDLRVEWSVNVWE